MGKDCFILGSENCMYCVHTNKNVWKKCNNKRIKRSGDVNSAFTSARNWYVLFHLAKRKIFVIYCFTACRKHFNNLYAQKEKEIRKIWSKQQNFNLNIFIIGKLLGAAISKKILCVNPQQVAAVMIIRGADWLRSILQESSSNLTNVDSFMFGA